MTFQYAKGYKTRDAAELALENMMPEEISEGEHPKVEPYTITKDGKRVTRYAITLPY